MTAALLNLATYTEYIQHLREEIEAALEEFGWTKAGMGKMVKLDSFLKESMRMNTLSFREFLHLVDQTGIIVFSSFEVAATRKVIKELTFSNGIRVPSGTFLSVAADAIHHDEVCLSRLVSRSTFVN